MCNWRVLHMIEITSVQDGRDERKEAWRLWPAVFLSDAAGG